MNASNYGLETKFLSGQMEEITTDGCTISGYASIFGLPDQSNDVVETGAFAAGLHRLSQRGSKVKMLWQHDPAQPIGVWDEVFEDEHGLYVRGHILPDVPQGAQALSLIKAGAIDGLSIGFKTITARKAADGRRLLNSVELWEVSLVTFPMLEDAKVNLKAAENAEMTVSALLRELRIVRRLVDQNSI